MGSAPQNGNAEQHFAFSADLVNTAKVAILVASVASVASGAVGCLLLSRFLPRAAGSPPSSAP